MNSRLLLGQQLRFYNRSLQSVRCLGDTSHPTDLFTNDSPDSWRAAGFAVNGAHNKHCKFGSFRIWFEPNTSVDVHKGFTAWSFANLDKDVTSICAVPVVPQPEIDLHSPSSEHPNGAISVDHIVIKSNNSHWIEREFRQVGILKKREMFSEKLKMNQAFYRPKSTIIEVISDVKYDDEKLNLEPQAYIWGITFVTRDIHLTHQLLPHLTKTPWAAVQPGRKLTTLNSFSAGLTTRIAFITPHVSELKK